MTTKAELVEMTADIVSAYVAANSIPQSELAPLIRSVFEAVEGLGHEVKEVAPPQEPAVPVKKSVTADYIICLEDGKRFKSLKRHLKTRYNMTPDEYRSKWGLPQDYPMVSPNYAKARSELAKRMGLGKKEKDDE